MLKSKPFEISVTGSYFSFLLPDDIICPFIDMNLKRVKVKASFERKELTFHGAIPKRNANHYMMFSQGYQKELDVFPNDYFQLQFFEDDSKYGLEMPKELEAVLSSDYEPFQIFESFTDEKKRAIIYMISRYKVVQTRIDKSLLVCENFKKSIRIILNC